MLSTVYFTDTTFKAKDWISGVKATTFKAEAKDMTSCHGGAMASIQ